MLKIITSLSSKKRYEYLTAELSRSDFEANSAVLPVLIVPEQFLFETERNVYRTLGAKKTGEIQITALSKLAGDAIKKYGDANIYADETVKSAAMFKTLKLLKPNLKYYKEKNLTASFAFRALELIGELKAANVSPRKLEKINLSLELNPETSANSKTSFSAKISDICEIYSAYNATLNLEFSDKLDDFARAAELILKRDCFKGKRVYIYEFDNFSESQLALIGALNNSADNLSVLLHTDKRASEDRAFKAMNTLIKRFELLNENSENAEYIELGGEVNTPEIEFWTCQDAYSESEFIAAKIRELATIGDEAGKTYAFNDIAVIACDPSNLTALKSAFADYSVSAFLDIPEPIIKKPAARFILSALEALSLAPDKLLSYIRSGFVRVSANLENKRFVDNNSRKLKLSDKTKTLRNKSATYTSSKSTVRLSKKSMDELEAATFTYRLTKKEWGEPFPEALPALRKLEPLREEIIGSLIRLKKRCLNNTGAEITEALCEFLIDEQRLQRTILGICGSLKPASKQTQDVKSKNYVEEFRQLWELIVGIFESLHVALGDFPVSVSEYVELLRGLFETTNIAKAPQVLDAVSVGDLERARFNEAKIAFIAGANQGSFPRALKRDNNGEFSGRELEALAELGADVKGNRENVYNYERYVANKALSLPADKLYIIAPLRSLSWEELAPSRLFNELSFNELSANSEVKKIDDLPLSFKAKTINSALRLFAETGDYTLKKALNELNYSVNAVSENNFEHFLTPETARKIFASNVFSPTSLETLNSCRFRYFCRYGLNLNLRVSENDEEPAAMRRGNIIHYCLDKALNIFLENPEKFLDFSDKDLTELAEKFTMEERALKLPANFAKTKRQEYILSSFKSGIVRMLKHIRSDFNNSEFKPLFLERRAEFNINELLITGKIDRTDFLKIGDVEYRRVIDYKSGDKALNFPAVFYGLDLQMLLYLFAVCDDDKTIPASAFYVPADGFKTSGVINPPINADNNAIIDEKLARKEWLSSHKPSGLIIADDVDPSPAYLDFEATNARYRAETDAHHSAKFFNAKKLSSEQFEAIKLHCEKLITVQANRLKRGNIAAIPLSEGTVSPPLCARCEYASACGNKGEKKVKVINKEALERALAKTSEGL